MPFPVEQEHVLHHRAGVMLRRRPRFGIGQEFHAADGAPQRHVAFVRIFAGRCAQ